MSATKLLSKEDVNETLEKSLSDIFSNDRFKDLLNVMANMKHYSLNNTILIVAQRPSATMVMGYKDWQKLGRYVQKGEKGISILAPSKRKIDMEKINPATMKPYLDNEGKPITEKKDIITGFFNVKVFDVEQTDGKEIPRVRDFISRNMQDDDYISKLYQDYKTFLVETKEKDIQEAPTDKGVGGYFRRSTNEIVISSTENSNDTEKFRVLIHEYAHALLHNKDSEMKDLPRGHKEAQAESVAYVVSKYYGLDSEDVSIGYIATWSQDIKLAKQALDEIQSVANSIIDDVDRLQKDQIKDFYSDQSKEYDEAKNHLIQYHGISEDAFDPGVKEETRIQLINKENGYIMSGKLEYNAKTDKFFLRTNRNLIEPLSELSKGGKLAVLNVEKELGQLKEITAYNRIPEHYQVKKIRNGPYVVQSAIGQDIISKGFEKKEDAKEFQNRSAISQALHQSTMLKYEKNNAQLKANMVEVTQEIEEQINKSVGEYLSSHSGKTVRPIGQSGTTIGWAMLKNPTLKTMDQIKEFADQNKHVPSYAKLQEAIVHVDDEKEKSTSQTMVIEEHEQIIER
ncbi:ArdC-like ssDNA-binding domain-containing protein [Cytobacillus oceanisediminis]|uniref:ArdC-like ssDNA-binding domain-containing protein n=1 Tax=Cytobacillus oceanisediminis TaxID=665099 RepID=UPI0020402670|nr:ArdC-like ssDNA-binding domain-containing protein [Cytobacillus oceanisediminis]MCM3405520.1 ImmA/IrrE family metallo-endopeptidase [Cytobacillus oceanisediminis]